MCRDNAVLVREPKLKVDLTRYVEEHNFLFDQSFDETVTNEMLYQACVRPLIDAVFQKARCTCFAYGQTGSGKTFTMMGPPRRQGECLADHGRTPGIFLLAAQDIFRGLQSKEYSHLGVYIAFYEIYCGKLFDLLNNRQILHARENAKSNVVIVGLQEHQVENVQQLMQVIEYGLNSRTTGVTGANVDSSRSHAILQITLKDVAASEEGAVNAFASQETRPKEHGKISFIDLAGSERGADTLDTDRQTRMDGAEINKSLLALKECIRALDQQSDHTPFRGSKLTQVLKDSFIGERCRTVMIANISPCAFQVEHSLNTLRYAYRVKELRRGSQSNPGAAPPTGNDVPMDEEVSSDDGSTGAGDMGDQVPPNVNQQMRVNNLSAAAQSMESRGKALAHERAHAGRHAQPADEVAAPRNAWVPPVQSMPSRGPYPSHGGGYAGSAQPTGASPEAMPELSIPSSHYPAVGSMEVPAARHQDFAPDGALEAVGGSSQAALDDLARQHDKLIGTILTEEEELITAHRSHIDTMVELIKEEMVHLNNVDRPGSDVDAYVAGLDRILNLKANYIGDIRGRVDLFKEHLQQEDAISRKFQSLASSSS